MMSPFNSTVRVDTIKIWPEAAEKLTLLYYFYSRITVHFQLRHLASLYTVYVLFCVPFCFLSSCRGSKGDIVRMSLPIQNIWESWPWVKIILSKGSIVSNHNFQTTKTWIPLSIHLICSCHNNVNSNILTKKSNKVNVSQHEPSHQQYASIISKNITGTNNADNFTCISVIADDITEAINDNNWFITATTNRDTIRQAERRTRQKTGREREEEGTDGQMNRG